MGFSPPRGGGLNLSNGLCRQSSSTTCVPRMISFARRAIWKAAHHDQLAAVAAPVVRRLLDRAVVVIAECSRSYQRHGHADASYDRPIGAPTATGSDAAALVDRAALGAGASVGSCSKGQKTFSPPPYGGLRRSWEVKVSLHAPLHCKLLVFLYL